jgi:protein-S-isoprenylcysteine O-methyltransferase Ste14
MPGGWWLLKVSAQLGLIGYGLTGLVGRGLFEAIATAPLWCVQVLAIGGAALELWHYVLLKRGAARLGAPEELVTSGGLYGRIRHPMYLGDVIVALGFFLLHVDWVSVTLLVAALEGVLGQARREDDRLAQQFGDRFERWRAETHLLIPGLF